MGAEEIIMDKIEQRRLIWYGHVRRMEDGRSVSYTHLDVYKRQAHY